MAKAEANISWLTLREGVARVARHLGCAPEDAELRIVGKAKAGLIKARGVSRGPASVAASRPPGTERSTWSAPQ